MTSSWTALFTRQDPSKPNDCSFTRSNTHTHTHTHTHTFYPICSTPQNSFVHFIGLTFPKMDYVVCIHSPWLQRCVVLCLVTQSCMTFCNPMDCSPPGSPVHRDSPGKNTQVDCHALLQGIFPMQRYKPGLWHCRLILNIWAIKTWMQLKTGGWDMHTNILETMG